MLFAHKNLASSDFVMQEPACGDKDLLGGEIDKRGQGPAVGRRRTNVSYTSYMSVLEGAEDIETIHLSSRHSASRGTAGTLSSRYHRWRHGGRGGRAEELELLQVINGSGSDMMTRYR